MPTGIAINWDNYIKKWLKFRGSKKEFCEKYGLNYHSAKGILKTNKKRKLAEKINEKKIKAFNKEIERKAEQEGKTLANQILEIQSSNLELSNQLEIKLKEFLYKDISKLDDLEQIIRTLHKLTGAIKNIVDYTKDNNNVDNNHKEILEFEYNIINEKI